MESFEFKRAKSDGNLGLFKGKTNGLAGEILPITPFFRRLDRRLKDIEQSKGPYRMHEANLFGCFAHPTFCRAGSAPSV